MSKKIRNEVIESSIVTTENVGTENVLPTYNDLLTIHKSKSQVIRHLHSSGMVTKDIYRYLTQYGVTNNDGSHPIRYQHVRNVIITPIKKK